MTDKAQALAGHLGDRDVKQLLELSEKDEAVSTPLTMQTAHLLAFEIVSCVKSGWFLSFN
jgi:hypothetical protein